MSCMHAAHCEARACSEVAQCLVKGSDHAANAILIFADKTRNFLQFRWHALCCAWLDGDVTLGCGRFGRRLSLHDGEVSPLKSYQLLKHIKRR